MRFLYLLCLLPFQGFADFSIKVIDGKGAPVRDVVLSATMQQADGEALINDDSLPVAIMDQVDMQFAPRVLITQTGQNVNFPNSDDTRHHVYSFSQTKVFEIKLYKGTHSAPITMDKPGIVELGCNIHDKMLGFIYVDDTGSAVKTDEFGKATMVGEVPASLLLWHPRLNHIRGERITMSTDAKDADGNILLVLDSLPMQIDAAPAPEVKRFKRKFSRQSQ